MKKLILLVVLMCYAALGHALEIKVGDLYYTLSGETASVSNNGYYNASYTIPSYITYNGLEYEVTGIGSRAFALSTASEIILPSTIKEIDDYAFLGCSYLTKIVIPENVTSIGSRAFSDASTLREVVFLPKRAPSGWTNALASKTYVPDLTAYSTTSTSTSYSILPIISLEKSTYIYSGQMPSMTFKSGISYFDINIETPSTSGLSRNVGTHDITVNAKITAGEYSYDTKVTFQYTITPVSIKVSTNDVSREYGDANPEFKIIYDGFVYGEDSKVLSNQAKATTVAIASSNIGKYPITISGATAQNYTFEYVPGVLTITPAPLKAEVKSVSREYGDSNPAFTFDFKGLKNNETTPAWSASPTFSTEATQASAVGNYTVTATATPLNYTLSEISAGVLTITPAKLEVTAKDHSRLYYEENPELTYSYSGFKNNENESIITTAPTLTTSAKLDSEVGEYGITVSRCSAPNYEPEYKNGTMTVSPRTLSVKTGTYDRVYGEENPTFELEYDGFVANEGIDNITTKPTATTKATKDSDVGSYAISISGGEATNYKFKYTQGQLNILKAEQEITWNQDLTNLSIGDQVELLAYASSELPITYSLDNSSVCEVYSAGNKNYIDCLKEGEVLIRASQSGNKNYYSSARQSKTIKVNKSSSEKPTLTIKQLPIGSITTTVDWGSIYALTISPEDNWVVNSITINGTDYTNKLDRNGTFTTPSITNNSTIIISYTNTDSGVNDTAIRKTKILGNNDGIVISGSDCDDTIAIYTIDGYLVKTAKSTGNELFIPLFGNKTYIIKVGSETFKIRL